MPSMASVRRVLQDDDAAAAASADGSGDGSGAGATSGLMSMVHAPETPTEWAIASGGGVVAALIVVGILCAHTLSDISPSLLSPSLLSLSPRTLLRWR